jgi:hypothetical protein
MQANADMIEGYCDGFNLDCPEPSGNRSRSYRHGFANGRADKSGKSRCMTFEELIRTADVAMLLDSVDSQR